nr:unnamed protein product [Digitaria exilis]
MYHAWSHQLSAPSDSLSCTSPPIAPHRTAPHSRPEKHTRTTSTKSSGANLIAAGVLVADDPAARVGPVPFHGARALAAFMRRHLSVVGLSMASCALIDNGVLGE